MIDILIAGGGPAGLAAAIRAAHAGLEAVVVEPRPAPVDKACGEGIMPGGLAALHALGVHPAGHPLRGIRYTDGLRTAQAPFRGAYGLGVRRTALHTALHERAEALGVRIVEGKVREVRQDGHTVTAAGLTARWLIAADGLHSPLRRALGLDHPAPGPGRYGLRRHYRTAPWSDMVEVHWSPHAEAYVTPVDDHLVGVAVLSRDRRPYADHLAAFPALAARLTAPAPPPYAGPDRCGSGRTGHGPGGSCWSGTRRATPTRSPGGHRPGRRHGVGGRRLPGRRAPEEYPARWRRATRRYRLLTHALLGAAGHPATRPLIVAAAHRAPALFRTAVRALQ
ncbi:NAD(P)/FAD-dependent oxidoreductase [Streptomyces sp. CBG31]|uniref:NAD(P)/FAD-dependent oxidoreductase n=1 Tax=Streptomyces sp. CBG31 TaxID=2762623 RepID=UPI0037DA6D70